MSAHLFKAGDPVVCVNASGFEHKLTVGKVYIVHSTSPYWVRLTDPKTWGLGGQATAGWDLFRFRPVQKRATDISIFTALLNPSDEDTFRELEAEVFEYEPVEVPFR